MFLESTKGRTKQKQKHVPLNEQKVPAGPHGGVGGEYGSMKILPSSSYVIMSEVQDWGWMG